MQAEHGVSLAAQEAKIREWAASNGATAVRIFRDEAISGKRRTNRPGLMDALATIGKGDALVVCSLSRLARSTIDTIEISEQLRKIGADLVSMSESIDTTTAAGKMVFQMMAVLAEFEREQLSERVRFALAHKRKRREKTGGSVPYGYRPTGADKVRLEPEQAEQQVISRILRWREQGASLRQIAAKLEKRGIQSKQGNKWSAKILAELIARAKRDALLDAEVLRLG